ncbi:MAG: sensor histidine kinase [Spirochaetaceae bacterium]|nr:MAG: sensor histidine kinase [Spirochaetaceae bacterium]
MKLRAKFGLLIMGIVIIPPLVVTGSVAVRISRMEREAGSTTRALVGEWLSRTRESVDGAESLSSLLESRPRGVEVAFMAPDGTVLASSMAQFPAGEALSATELLTFLQHTGRSRTVSIEPMNTDDGVSGPLALISFPRPTFSRSTSDRRWEGLLFASAALVLFVSLMSYFMVRHLKRRLLSLEDAAQRIAGGDLDFALTPAGKDEFTSLTESFEQMRRSLKDEYAKRSRFILGVSHDLRTPIALIQGYAEALQDGYARDPEKTATWLGVIREKAARLDELVTELLDFSRVETETWRQSLAPVNLAEFLRNLADRYALDAELVGRVFTAEITLPEDTQVAMDERLVRRALDNIIGNALRYTDPGGQVRLESAVQDGCIYMIISDDGPGMDASQASRAFEPFYRAENARSSHGFGLGLATAKSVLEAHSWHIALESEPGGGTKVTVKIVGA